MPIDFNSLPLVIEGESKEVRYLGGGKVAIRFKPTIYSFTHNRCDVVPGSERIRLETSKTFMEVLKRAGIKHSYQEVLLDENLIISQLVMPAQSEFEKYGIVPFVPHDLTPAEIAALPRAPSIEVIVKNTHTGTSKHRYIRMNGAKVRASHPTLRGMPIAAELPYPKTMVRFDWRNPLIHPDKGIRVADEILPENIADYFIDVKRAHHTALRVNHALSEFLGARDIVLYDLCLFIAEDGETVYGEVSPDCGRFRHFFLGSLDKDVWRTGGSSSQVLEKWKLLANIIEGPPFEKESDYMIPTNRNSNLGFLIGTGNPYKVREFEAILNPIGIPFEVVNSNSEPEETGSTFMENARIKAIEYAKQSGKITISEDSGLVIPAIKGLPGVHAARFADCKFDDNGKFISHTPSGRSREDIDAENNRLVMEMMVDVPLANRGAWFEIALVVASPDGNILFEESATCPGWITKNPSGTGGFGYDSIFIGDRTDGVTFADLDAQRKNLRSHRRKVLRKFSAWLCTLIRKQQENVVVIDGNDGTGKSTVVEKLKMMGWNVKDRGIATKLTDDSNAGTPGKNEIHIILDAPVEISQRRLLQAGKSLNEKYHTLEDLKHYRTLFMEVAQVYNMHIVDSSGSPENTMNSILKHLL